MVPAAVFTVTFGVSIVYFEANEGSRAEPGDTGAAPRASARLVVTYWATADDPGRGFLGSIASDGSDLRNVIEPPGGDRAANNAAPSVAPSGDRVAFQRATSRPGKPLPPYIHVIPLDGSKPERRVTRGAPAEVDPAWAPNGKRIAFARDVNGSFDLFACAPDGSRLTRLTGTPGVDELTPAWSPDSAQITFARYEDGPESGSGDLWLMSADGTEERRLLGDAHDYSGPAWSPDGERLALLMDAHVAVWERGRGVPRQLTSVALVETRPSWSPDGRRIAFTRDPGTIITVAPDGSRPLEVPFERAATGVAWASAP